MQKKVTFFNAIDLSLFTVFYTLTLLSASEPEVSDDSEEVINTVVGAAIAVGVPLGEYFDDKLLNLSANRYTIRPQIGVVHTRGPWSYELTGSIFFFTDNDNFLNGNEFEQKPFYAVQAHIVRFFEPGLWASLSAGYEQGAASKVNGVDKDDKREGFISAFSLGTPPFFQTIKVSRSAISGLKHKHI